MTLEQITTTLISFIQTNQAAAVPIVFALAFGESLAFVSLLVPATSILVAISALLGASGVGFFGLWLAATIGSILGYAISYWIGYIYKDQIRQMWPFAKRPEMVARGEALFARHGALGVFFGHFLGPVRAVIPVVAGMCAMPQLQFQIANVASSAMWSAGVLAPALLAGHWTELRTMLGPLGRLLGGG